MTDDRSAPADLPDPYPVEPLAGGFDARPTVPGSRSVTNRALVCASLAAGESRLEGFTRSDDVDAMCGVARAAGAVVHLEPDRRRATVTGVAGTVAPGPVQVDVRLSGTTSRFSLPLLALGAGPATVDAGAAMRARPMAETFGALRALGAEVDDTHRPGHLPATVRGPLRGGQIEVRGDVSSQFLSGLLLTAPCLPEGLHVDVTTELVSRPYVAMTAAVMRTFGGHVAEPDDATFEVAPTGYHPPAGGASYRIEPDASGAAYLFAAAAVCGGRVTIEGLGADAVQGDTAFVDVLERMGASVTRTATATTVAGTGALRGGDFDLTHFSDQAQTLAVVAAVADSPTRVTGIGFIRAKETDRIAAVVAELNRCGIDATEDPDGFTIHPGRPRRATVQTYDDHRMAMSFALLGLLPGGPGIDIADPGCVAKTFPDYFDVLGSLRGAGSAGR